MTKSSLLPTRLRPGLFRRCALIAGVSLLAIICQQPVVAQEDQGTAQTANLPQSQPVTLPPQATQNISDPGPRPYEVSAMSDADSQTLQAALQSVRTHSFTEADSLAHSLSNPVARKIVTWAIINNDGDIYSFASLDAARRDLWGWPREAKRQIAAEKMIATSGMSPQQVADWFSGSPPQSVEGATALITAYGLLNRTSDAQALAKQWWRTQVFDSLAQANFYSAFGKYLTPDDNKARLICLLINPQSGTPQAVRDMQSYVDEPSRLVASAVLAMRTGSAAGDGLYETALSNDPHNLALAFERARYLLKKGLEPLGFAILPDLPPASLSPDAASQIYALRLGYFHAAMKARDYRAAYNAMNGGGFDAGESKAESEFFAGWIALVKLHDIDHAIS
ncbi:MAG: lytic transglycosylase domain-containing protein, partial [Asticcacaulis sp.]